MARGSMGSGRNFINVRLKGMRKSDLSPYFEISRGWDKSKKQPEEIISDDATFIEGRLSRIEPSTFEYEGRTLHTITLHLVDNENNCLILNSGYTGIMKIWLLKLASAEKLGLLKFSVYCKDGKKRGWLTNDGEAMESKYDWEKEIKPLTEWYPNGTSDDRKLIEFLEGSVLDRIRGMLSEDSEDTGDVESNSEPTLEEDLPFN